MPTKLVLAIVILVIGAIVNLIAGSILSAIIGGALTFGVIIGNDGVRQFLRAMAGLQILSVFALAVGPALASGAAAGSVVAAGVLSVGIALYLIWALGQEDVRTWMFRKNFKLDQP